MIVYDVLSFRMVFKVFVLISRPASENHSKTMPMRCKQTSWLTSKTLNFGTVCERHGLNSTNSARTSPASIMIFATDCVVTPTALYASGAWTLTKDREMTLLRTQRRMTRLILGAGRRRHKKSQQLKEAPEVWHKSGEAPLDQITASPATETNQDSG